VGFGCLYQILQSSLGRIRQGSPLAWSHRHSELGCLACHLGSLAES
jgi:hypothetical protein